MVRTITVVINGVAGNRARKSDTVAMRWQQRAQVIRRELNPDRVAAKPQTTSVSTREETAQARNMRHRKPTTLEPVHHIARI
jgi:hypothetical protein